ncbi:tetratricopeptide repeat protein [Aquimarina longa]|uniref:tetratricopeptide repeat protein n=1 Tax=Aquimarina longa TaxID=1080221 RepID=UPI00078522E0|nr:tetratricopeptide repeat protein [Aquimarina longa]
MSSLEKEIEKYLNQEMSSEEKNIFEEKINNSPEAKKLLELYQEMDIIYNDSDWETTEITILNAKTSQYETFLKSEKGKAITTSIRQAENEYFTTISSPKKKYFIVYAGSIAAILIIGLFIVFQLNKPIDSKSLYAEYKNWNDLPSLTVRDVNTNLAQAERLFREKKYTNALEIFNTYHSDTNSLNPQVLLYIAIAQLELDQNKLAIENFNRLLNSDTLDAPKAHWYLALTYLKLEKIEEAKNELQILLKDSSNIHTAAQKLLDELK